MPKRITKLTREQASRMKPWADEWIAHGLRTGETDWTTAEAAIVEMYRLAKVKPVPCVHVTSPIVGVFAAPIAANIISSLTQKESCAVGDAVDSAVRSAVYSAVGDAVDSAVRSAVYSAVYSAVGDAVGNTKIWWHYWYGGQFWSYWAAWTSFYVEICSWKPSKTIQRAELAYRNYAKSACYSWPNKSFCMICARPSTLYRNTRGQLHADGRMAISWPDTWGLWMLNGVQVPQWLAEPRAEMIDPRKFAEIDNAEIRREFIRKVGVERIAQHCGAQRLDKKGNYELLEIDFNGRTGKWPYLKMLNPSIGVWHLECVDRSCKTVSHALAWRNQSSTEPKELT